MTSFVLPKKMEGETGAPGTTTNGITTKDYTGRPRPGKTSYLSVPAEFPLLDITVGDLVDVAAVRYGSAEALFDRETNARLSFKDVKQESENLAAGFLSLGLHKGDRVGLWGPNSRRWYITKLALAKAGLIAVFINPAYQSSELLYCLNKVQAKGLVIAGQLKTQNFYDILVQAVPELKESQQGPGRIKSDHVPSLTIVVTMEYSAPSGFVLTFDQVLKFGQNRRIDCCEDECVGGHFVGSDDVFCIQFTSGTTGKPKAIMLTHHSVVSNSLIFGKRLGLNSKDKLCLTVPMFHIIGSSLGAIAALHFGSEVVLPSSAFSAAASVRAAIEEGCTIIYGTPTMHSDMVDVIEHGKEGTPAKLRKAITGGAVCSAELMKRIKTSFGVTCVDVVYGQTEAGAYIQSLPTDSDQVRARTMGYPLEHTEIKLVNEKWQVVPLGIPGEVCIRAYSVMRGYWEDEERTSESINKNGWFHSGDLCIMEPSGHVQIVGRIKDMIIRGGENIYPREIEDFLQTHPAISEAHVFGVPDERLGEVVGAWIRLKEGTQELGEEEVRLFCKGKIAHYKIPKYVKFTSDSAEFPKTASGKVQKFRMQEILTSELNL